MNADSGDLPTQVVHAYTQCGLTVATCESLTAGLVGGTLATVPGASKVLRGGLVTYATELKSALAGVDAELLEKVGAVDAEVARQMARGARRACAADVAVACTGVAGPDMQDGKPVGTVFVAVATRDGEDVREHAFEGDRASIRQKTVEACCEALLRITSCGLSSNPVEDPQ
ncbi:CinA family protein [Brevibacterium sp. UMB10442]|nr:CinA family protein [Brevibacterium sp. UMB10442]